MKVGDFMLDAALRSVLYQFLTNVLRERTEYFTKSWFEEAFFLRDPEPVKVDDIMEAHQKLLDDLIKDEDVAGVLKWHREFLEEVNAASGKEKGKGCVTEQTWMQSEEKIYALAKSLNFLVNVDKGLVLDRLDTPDFRCDFPEAQESIRLQQAITGEVRCSFTDSRSPQRRHLVIRGLPREGEPVTNPIPRLLDIEHSHRFMLQDEGDPLWLQELCEGYKGEVPFSEFLKSRHPDAVLYCDDSDIALTKEETEPAKPIGDKRSDPPTPMQKLRCWVTKDLKGKQRRVLELLIDNDGKCPIADLAADGQISWQSPYENAWNSMRTTLNGKLKPQGWRIECHDHKVRLIELSAQK